MIAEMCVDHCKRMHKVQACWFRCSSETIFWQGSTTLHYYAKIIIHPQQRRTYESQKSFQACWVWPEEAEWESRGYTVIILKGLFHLMGKDETRERKESLKKSRRYFVVKKKKEK